MPLSWISGSKRAADVDTLVSRGKYAKAAKALRSAFEGRQPTLAERLRYADLLVLAERGSEALPVLLGVADEQARYGFHDKAIEALRRAEAIDSRDPQVRDRIRTLHEARVTAERSTSAPTPRGGEDWDKAPQGAFGGTAPAPGLPEPPAASAPDSAEPSSVGGALEGASAGEEMVVPETELVPEEPEAFVDEADLAPVPDATPADGDPGMELVLFEEPAAPTRGELRPLLTESDLEGDDIPMPGDPDDDMRRLHAFLLLLGRTQREDGPGLGAALFADFPREQVPLIAGDVTRRRYAPGDVLVTEGDPGHSVFLIARGSVRILVRGGHGQPFDVRRLDAGDSFGEVAVLTGWPRSATVVAATSCDTLEVDRSALEAVLDMRPRARRLLEELARTRAESPEEKAVRSLPAEAADPERAAEALRAHFGGSEWSFRVRLHLAQLMLDVGRQEEALAILAGVAEDLARHGHAQKAIALLKKVEWIRRRGGAELTTAPPKKGRRRSPRPRPSPPAGAQPLLPPDASAVVRAAFREWVGSMLRQTHALAARPATARDVEEEAEAEREDDAHAFAQRSA